MFNIVLWTERERERKCVAGPLPNRKREYLNKQNWPNYEIDILNHYYTTTVLVWKQDFKSGGEPQFLAPFS